MDSSRIGFHSSPDLASTLVRSSSSGTDLYDQKVLCSKYYAGR